MFHHNQQLREEEQLLNSDTRREYGTKEKYNSCNGDDEDLSMEEEEEEAGQRNVVSEDEGRNKCNSASRRLLFSSLSLIWIVIIPLSISIFLASSSSNRLPSSASSSFDRRRILYWSSPFEERLWQMFWGDDNYILDKLRRATTATRTAANDSREGATNSTSQHQHDRKLSLDARQEQEINNKKSTAKHTDGPKLVLGGKLVLNADTQDSFPANIAQYDLINHEWDTEDVVLLSLYNSYASGEVYSILANHSDYSSYNSKNHTNNASDHQSKSNHNLNNINTQSINSSQTTAILTNQNLNNANKRDNGITNQKHTKLNIRHAPSDNKDQFPTIKDTRSQVIVVGAFDTTSGASQVTYCSLAAWDGYRIDKVGEGLCNSAYLPRGMKITCAAMAGSQEIYVAGSFATQVWMDDMHKFVNIYNIAHYDASKQVWTPLPVGHITCSWCIVTVLALAWDSKRRQLHVAGKFNGIDGLNIPSGLAIYDADTGHLVAHPGGGLTMANVTQDGVGTALQLDEEADVLYVMGSFERIGLKQEMFCAGMAAYELSANKWTCLADSKHAVLPSGGGNMLLTPYGLMVAGRTPAGSLTTWPNPSRPYTIALLKATLKSGFRNNNDNDNDNSTAHHDFSWSWLPGFDGHEEPIHTLANGVGDFEGTVFIGGDNLVAMWYYDSVVANENENVKIEKRVPVTRDLSLGRLRGQVMAIAQLQPPKIMENHQNNYGYEGPLFSMTRPFIIALYFLALGALMGVFLALLCNRGFPKFGLTNDHKQNNITFSKVGGGISLDMLTYSAVENTGIAEAYQRAMRTRFVKHAQVLSLIDPQEIILHRIIGEGRFGRVWSAKWRSSRVAVKEFVFAQAAVKNKAAGRSSSSSSSSQSNMFIEEIIGEAGMMAMLRHPNVLQLFGCSLTAQAIWIVSELMSLGSLRQLLDDPERELSMSLRLRLALQVAEGMMYLHEQNPPIIHRDLKSHNIFVHETLLMEPSMPSSPAAYPDSKNKAPSNKDNKNNSNEKLDTNTGNDIISNAESSDLFIPAPIEDTTLIAKIGDWGSARATLSGSRTMTHSIGTACWLAPEVIQNARSSKKSDVYAYGIILWELATREEVYAGLESTQIIARVANDNLRPHPIPQLCPWKDVMEKCWHEDPSQRLEFAEIVAALSNILESITIAEEQEEEEQSV